jgi:hypothetical protein
MNKISLLLAGLLGAAAISAQAGELYAPTQYQDAPGALTRAQVKQSVLAARRAGELDHNDIDLPGNGTLMTNDSRTEFGKTRAAVKAEVLAARADGELNHNDVDLPNVAKGSVLNRQDVKAEAVASTHAAKPVRSPSVVEY